jgi:hypothetical protein
MTNISMRRRILANDIVSVPLIDGSVTRRDVSDLLFFADQKYEEVHGEKPRRDDAYLIRCSDDNLFAVIVSEVAAQ